MNLIYKMKKLTTKEFIKKANKIHNNKYNYSLVDYKNNKTPVKIICPIHGEFKQRPSDHLKSKTGCYLCGKRKSAKVRSFNLINFVEKARKKHGYKYDYSLIDYINSRTKIKIICPIHGVFEQLANNHVLGRGCKKCNLGIINKDVFVEKSNKIHNNKYDYSLIDYIDSKTSVKIICPIHGIFEQKPNSHLNGKGCKYCVKNDNISFIKKSNKIHNNKYDYSLVNYINNKTPVKIICPIHKIFKQRPDSHINGKGCPNCKSSKGELKIKKFLIENNIKFEEQFKFKNLKYKSYLRFDFYLPKFNILIEYDGELHFKAVECFGGQLELTNQKNRDELKNKFCKKENIKLIRIPYWEKENIYSILKKELKDYNL